MQIQIRKPPKRPLKGPKRAEAKPEPQSEPITDAPIPPPVDAQGQPLDSDALIAYVHEHYGHKILLSFSGGKDSIALWLHLRPHFEIVPYFLFWVPGLSWVDEAIAYYENFFGQRIVQLPHPLFYNMVRTGAYQEPHVVGTVDWLHMPRFDFADIDAVVAVGAGLDPERTLCAVGFRQADNIQRRNLIVQMGAIGTKRRKYYYGIWDWDVQDVADIIIKHDVALPADYRFWGRTIAAYDYQFLKPLKEHFPADYEKMRTWFPLIDAEFFRYESMAHEED